MINENIVITVVEVRGDKVRLGIQAPREVPIHRSEVYEALSKLSGEKLADDEASSSKKSAIEKSVSEESTR